MTRKMIWISGLGALLLAAIAAGSWAQEPVLPAPAPAQAPAPAPIKKGKAVYTGPDTVIEQPPTPMLDAEGKQRLDPDGKPMFNPPVRQQRDKYGHPLFDEKGQPVFQTATELGFDEHRKRMHAKKEKAHRTIDVAIAQGTMTVDGMIGKAGLNYDIKDFKFIYLYAPWIGTVVVSNVPFSGSKEQARAFDQHTLTVNVEEHTFQVYSENMLLGKKPEPAFVAVDRDFKLPAQAPVMGYGVTQKAPYSWPGAKANPESKAAVKAPPVPLGLRPTMQLPPCPKGQMRAAAGAALPRDAGQTASCLAIAAAPDGTVPPASPHN